MQPCAQVANPIPAALHACLAEIAACETASAYAHAQPEIAVVKLAMMALVDYLDGGMSTETGKRAKGVLDVVAGGVLRGKSNTE